MKQQAAYELMINTVRRTQQLGSALSLLAWDNETIRPPKGADARAQVMGSLATEAFRIATAPEYGEALDILAAQQAADPDAFSELDSRMLEEELTDYQRFSRIPTEEYEKYQVLTAGAHSTWVQAKTDDDFTLFAPVLAQIIEYEKRFASYWGFEHDPYDGLLSEYDPDMLGAQIDPIFARLLEGTRALMEQLPEQAPPLALRLEPAEQKALALYLLGEIGYDLQAGNLFETEHPFTSRIHAGDARVTTHYYPDQPTSSIFSVLHEGGHGIVEQNISPELDGTNMINVRMSVHESQSRFFENIIGRSRAFWDSRFAEASRIAGQPLARDAQQFWRSINAMKPSLIRIEADELTYAMHIIIRYEIERALFNEGLAVSDLPEVWNQKYQQYLGVVPATDAQGVLQDVHWSGGSFGYFPSYALGNLIGAQLAATAAEELGSFDTLLPTAEGLGQVRHWLNEKVHRRGALTKPADLLLQVTGSELDPTFFLDYMAEKIAALR